MSLHDANQTNGGVAPFRVLIAEDDFDVADLLALMLEDRGYEVTVAENGQVAVERMEEASFDLLLCDLWMPKMDGLAVLDWCQRHRPELAVAVLTAQREAKANVTARPNVRAWLLKPFSLAHQARLEELIASLRGNDGA